jgi:hypothetical protein
MSNELLAPIWRRLDCEPPVFFADRVDAAFAEVRDRLIVLGYIREADPAQFSVCGACGGGHVRRVSWVENARTGERSPYLPCPQCGSVRIEAERLKQWVVDIPHLLSGLFHAAGGRVAISELVPSRLWYLGSATWLGHSRQAYFMRAIHVHSRPAVLAAIRQYPRAVLFHPTERSVRLWGETTQNPMVALESVVALSSNEFTFDSSLVEGRLVDAGFGDPKPNQSGKRDQRAGKIERLVMELREHLLGARNHAFATRDLSGTPQLLARPTQKDLAARCGLTESDVSRCINDEEAVLLQLLWETADNLDQVIRWNVSVGSDPP